MTPPTQQGIKTMQVIILLTVLVAVLANDDSAIAPLLGSAGSSDFDSHAEVPHSALSDWTTWSDCSRTCGGGASFARRFCQGGNCAAADSKGLIRYRTCNTQACESALDFRSMQCSVYNNVPYQGTLYRWVPETGGRYLPCALYCRANGTDIVALISPKVLDGTRCRDDSLDMCIGGVCKSVGCDGQLESEARFDVCGVCRGKGATCRLVTGIYTPKPRKRQGSEVVIKVPQNSRHISVSERGSGHVGLLLNDSSEADFMVPSKIHNKTNGVLKTSGLIVQYGRLRYGKEYFEVPGPVPKDINVMAMYDENLWKYIRYEFYRPLMHAWKYDESTVKCTTTCGGGLQFLRPYCFDLTTGDRKDAKFCREEGVVEPSPKVHRCNVEDCPVEKSSTGGRSNIVFEYVQGTKWQTDPWTYCSASCAGGFQTRTMSCVEMMIDGRALATVDESPCHDAGLKVPESRRACNDDPCPTWNAMPWTRCSVTCGRGWQQRVVRCQTFDSKPSNSCDRRNLPVVRKACFVPATCFEPSPIPLPVAAAKTQRSDSNGAAFKAAIRVVEISSLSAEPSWSSESWGPCSTSCGVGVTTRAVRCMVMRSGSGIVEEVEESECLAERPLSSQQCSMGPCHFSLPTVREEKNQNAEHSKSTTTETPSTTWPTPQNNSTIYAWNYLATSPCTTSCGNGVKVMEQFCFHVSTDNLVAKVRCDITLKLPAKFVPCSGSPCSISPPNGNNTKWVLGAWGDCSVTCGRGIQERSVVCRKKPEKLDSDDFESEPWEIMPKMMCPRPKPQSTNVCPQVPCEPEWVAGPWGKCDGPCSYQYRNLTCHRMLGTGRKEEVSQEYCSKMPPIRRRCQVTRNCRPRYVTKKWQKCKKRCGREFVRRVVSCIVQKPGRAKPVRVHKTVCKKLRRPIDRKRCKLPRCPQFRPSNLFAAKAPVIVKTKIPFIQTDPQPVVRVDVGAPAFVFPNTTVVIRCKVNRFRHGTIEWLYEGQPMTLTRRLLLRKSDRAVRILKAGESDSGNYTCLAGPTSASAHLFVAEDTDGASQILSFQNPPAIFDVPTPINNNNNKFEINQIDNIDNIDNIANVGNIHKISNIHKIDDINSNKISNNHENSHKLQPTAPQNLSLDQLKVVSYAPKPFDNNPFLVKQHDVPPIQTRASLPNYQFSTDSQIERFLVQFHTKLQEENETSDSDLFEIESELEQTGAPDVLFVIPPNNQIPDESISNAPSIIRQSTLPPFQMGTEVSAYVGGNLVLVGAARVDILCEATGNPPPAIEWYKDDIKLPDSNLRQYSVLRDNSLRIFEPHEWDAGVYMCVARNRHGNDSVSTVLSVTQKPKIFPSTEDFEDFVSDVVEVTVGSRIRAKLGAKVTIRCPANAYPEPYVIWRKDSDGLSSNSNTLPDNSLELDPTTRADQGLFACEATNPSGSDYQASTLVLIDPPHETNQLSESPDVDGVSGDLPGLLMARSAEAVYSVKANSSVMMGCPVTGFPDPAVVWHFNGTPIVELGAELDYQLLHQDKILQIPVAGKEAVGVYTCTGVNEGGNCTTSLRLELIVYSYAVGNFSECTAECGGSGVKQRILRCLTDTGKEVDQWYCTGLDRPELKSYPCNRVDCPPRFITGRWESCSATCGNGTRTRATPCVVLMSDGGAREVADEECLAFSEQPSRVEACFSGACPWWKPDPWRRCSKKCVGSGVGRKLRRLRCMSGNGTKELPRSACKGQPRPSRTSSCSNRRCVPVWVTSPWSVCSKACGRDGFRTRILRCVYRGRRQQAAGKVCPAYNRPAVRMPCNRRSCSRSRMPAPGRFAGRPCVNTSRDCAKIKHMGLCSNYMKVCCDICTR